MFLVPTPVTIASVVPLSTQMNHTISTKLLMQVVFSSALFASSHLTMDGFFQLFVLGTALGTSHVLTNKNLWVPTVSHSLYNMAVYLALVAVTVVTPSKLP
jgi:membrane protease YdiL (CAAX protease family)